MKPETKGKVGHTPTPWKVDGESHHKIHIFKQLEDGSISGLVAYVTNHLPEYKANAAFICKAVNAHGRYEELMRNASAILRDSASRLGSRSPEYGVLHSLADDLYNATVAKAEAL